MELKRFTSTAKSLSRNPLGIIALFIVLVYAIAGVVISLAKEDFYTNPLHPSVIFLSIFPLCVLLVFAFLVAKHHDKLYGPEDYKNEQHFLATFNKKSPIQGDSGIATSDNSEYEITESEISRLDREYEKHVNTGFCLIHLAEEKVRRTSPGSGRYEVRVWIESIEGRSLNEIKSVTYKVWSDFKKDKFKTESKSTNFDLWLRAYGEFPVLALIELTNGESVILQRYLDLPNRPPD